MPGGARTPRQIPLDLPWPRNVRAARSDFIVSDNNAEALGLIDGWRDWPDGRLVLTGPEGAGKTHLAMIWAQDVGAAFIEAEALNESPVRDIASAGAVVLEDCERKLGGAETERALFHLLNILRDESGHLLMTARTAPARWGVALPDLASRLSAATVAKLHRPDENLLTDLVVKLFADRGILVNRRVAAYITKRIERSFAAAEAAVSALDAHALETGKPVGIKMAGDLFGW